MAFIGALLATVVLLPAVTQTKGMAVAGVPYTVTLTNPVYVAAPNGSQLVTATVRDSEGRGVSNQTVVWTSDGGAGFSPQTSPTNSNGVATVTVSANGTTGSQTITGRAGTASGSATVYAYGPPARLTLTLQPTTIPADGVSTSRALLTVTDGHNPADPNPTASVRMTRGAVNLPVTNNGDGTYSSTITASTTAQVETITATETGSSLSTTAQLTDYGPANHVDVTLSRPSIPATGTAQPAPTDVTITGAPHNDVHNPYDPEPARPSATATVTDSNGSRVLNEIVQFSASGGATFGSVTNNGDGTYTALITSSSTPGTETISATATRAGVSGSTPLKETFGALHTSGTSILDANNTPVMLRGLNMHISGPGDDYWQHSYFKSAFYDHARDDWGANVLRNFIDLDQWMKPCPTTQYNTNFNYRQAFQEYVKAATERGMYVILTLGSVPRHLCDTSGAYVMAESDPANPADDAPSFWADVANTFKSNPMVGFELYNEPHSVYDSTKGDNAVTLSNDTWLNGGPITCTSDHASCAMGTPPWTATGMQPMYNAVRGTGATNLVFVDGQGWADLTPPALISSSASHTHATDPPATNVVYAVHYYSCPTYARSTPANTYACGGGITPPQPGDTCTTTPTPAWNNPAAVLQNWVTWRNANQVPIMETEFGWPNNANAFDSCFSQSTISFDEANGIPWSAYAWFGWSEPFNMATYPDGGDFSPTISGQPVKNGLANNQN